MSQEGATSIQDLQGQQPPATGASGDGSRAVVQEILQEIESNDQKNNQQNVSQQQYNLDPNVQQASFAPQNQEESRRMQQEMMMQQQQQMMQQQMQMEQEHNEMAAPPVPSTQTTKTFTERIISQIKSPVIVAAIFLLLSLAPTKQLLQKIPKALSETGNITFVGSAVTALIAGILFFAISMATKNI